MTRGYTTAVQLTIRYAFLSILLFGGLIFVTYELFQDLRTGHVRAEDKGTIFVFSYNPPAASLTRTDALTKEIYSMISPDTENVKNIVQFAGLDFMTFSERTNAAATIVKLTDWDERKRPEQHALNITQDLNKKLFATSDGFSFGVVPPPIRGMGIAGGFELYVQDRTGGDIATLQKYVSQIIQ